MFTKKSEAAPATAKTAAPPTGKRIGAPDDVFERKADRTADEVLAMDGPRFGWSISRMIGSAPLQRKCACGGSGGPDGECEGCKDKKALQRRSTGGSGPATAPPITEQVLRSPGRPLDATTREFFEPRFGYDFGKVRIHSDAAAAESAQGVNALAYTVGNHIAFGPGAYQPQRGEGRQLLAHELAHVVQQSQDVAASPAREDHLEAEANRAAAAMATQSASPTLTRWGRAGLQRQARGGGQTPPQPTAPNKQQQGIIDAARKAAAIRSQTALFRVRGIGPGAPPEAIDAQAEMSVRARSLAQVMFQWDNPNMEQIGDVISSMVNYLTSGVQVMIAGGNDPDCGTRAAYVRGLRPPIVLCPLFFSGTAEEQIRTMIHETAHLSRIGKADLGESYCGAFDCKTSCGGFDAADSWAHYVHCLSGQAADKGIAITGKVPAGGQTPPQQGGGGAKPTGGKP